MTFQGRQVRIGIVGCGAISQSHAGAFAAVAGAHCAALYDLDASRAEGLRKTCCPDALVTRGLEEMAEHAGAAIVAVPNAFHADVSKKLLRMGLHVLCEKPLATSLKDAREVVTVAEEAGRILTCGLVRRFYGSTALVAETLRRGLLGSPLRFEARESVWNWPFTRATFDPKITGGGVLIDTAPHIFDLVEAWFGPAEVVEYVDDSRGGVEAVAVANLRCYNGGSCIDGEIILSRAYRTENRMRIRCSNGYIDVNPHERDCVTIVFTDGQGPFVTTAHATPVDPFVRQLENFVAAIRGDTPPEVTPDAAVKAVELVESCYEVRQPLAEQWSPAIQSHSTSIDCGKILVTGASGAVGSRLVEMWAEQGSLDRLRGMVRSYRTAARILRFPLEVVEADLLDKDSVRRAAAGCDAVVHLGVGEKAARETQTIIDVACELGIRRFVHLSTAAVYGRLIPVRVEQLQEGTQVVRTGEPYADEKAEAERIVVRACGRGVDAIILRPHIVYGPGLRWSAELMELLAEGKAPIIEDGGWCNLIHVDDLVEAIRLALLARKGFGEPMFVTDGNPIRWTEYIAAHAALIDARPERMTRNDVLASERSLRRWIRDSVQPLIPLVKSREFRNFVFESPAMQATVFRAYLALRNAQAFRPYIDKFRAGSGGSVSSRPGEKQFNEMWTMLQLSEARLSSEKAGAILGFRPKLSFGEGLRHTAVWFGLYGLAPSDTRFDERPAEVEVSSTLSL